MQCTLENVERQNERQNGTKETPTLPASFWNQTTLMNVVGRNLDKSTKKVKSQVHRKGLLSASTIP